MEIDESRAEQDQREQTVEALALEFGWEIHEVQEVYERAYLDLKSDATITDYLPLFAARRTRALLRERRS
jgi:hypothetical protein